jgi:serpin B
MPRDAGPWKDGDRAGSPTGLRREYDRTVRSAVTGIFLGGVLAATLAACGAANQSPSDAGQGPPERTPDASPPSDASPDRAPAGPPSDSTTLATDDQRFAVALYQQLRGQSGNLVVSPASISVALAMLYNGAANETASQMASALDFSLPLPRLNAAFSGLDLTLATPPPDAGAGAFQLSLANALWVQQGFSISPTFTDALTTSYGAGPQSADFVTDAEAARAAINGWVASQTDDQIPMLFPAGSIDETTRLVLADAVYFQSDWTSPFTSSTADGSFQALTGPVTVPTMGGAGARLWSGTGWNAAALAYQGGTTSMVMIVPDAGTFASFEQGLTADGLTAILAAQTDSGGELSMPRFKFSTSTNLDATLSALGMPDAFGPTADFSGIDGTTDLFVGAVLHQADISVGEKGTTAAAATGVSVDVNIVISPTLLIDRPFLFFIIHQPTGAILFEGRVVDPSMTN